MAPVFENQPLYVWLLGPANPCSTLYLTTMASTVLQLTLVVLHPFPHLLVCKCACGTGYGDRHDSELEVWNRKMRQVMSKFSHRPRICKPGKVARESKPETVQKAPTAGYLAARWAEEGSRGFPPQLQVQDAGHLRGLDHLSPRMRTRTHSCRK